MEASKFNQIVSDMFKEEKYFLTQSGKIVQGQEKGGQIINAQILKQNLETNPVKLKQLQQEVNLLKKGQLSLQEIPISDYEKYNICAGKTPQLTKKQMEKKSSPAKSSVKIYGGEVEKGMDNLVIDGGAGGAIDGGAGGAIDGGAKKPKKKAPIKKRSRSKSASKNSQSNEVWGGKIEAPGFETTNDNVPVITLKSLFEKVKESVASQAQDIILNGGDPTKMLKEDINYFEAGKARKRTTKK